MVGEAKNTPQLAAEIFYQINDAIEISMQSAEIFPEENRDYIILSEINTIRGKLHFDKVKNIKLDSNSR